MQFFPASWYFLPLMPKYSPQHSVLRHPQSVFFSNGNDKESKVYSVTNFHITIRKKNASDLTKCTYSWIQIIILGEQNLSSRQEGGPPARHTSKQMQQALTDGIVDVQSSLFWSTHHMRAVQPKGSQTNTTHIITSIISMS